MLYRWKGCRLCRPLPIPLNGRQVDLRGRHRGTACPARLSARRPWPYWASILVHWVGNKYPCGLSRRSGWELGAAVWAAEPGGESGVGVAGQRVVPPVGLERRTIPRAVPGWCVLLTADTARIAGVLPGRHPWAGARLFKPFSRSYVRARVRGRAAIRGGM